jgi:hypothetical protein
VTIVDGVSNNISGMLFRAQEAGNTEYAPALAETTMATMDNQELANRYSRAIKEAGQTAVGADIIITMPTDERILRQAMLARILLELSVGPGQDAR